ncbi:unnamed protein product [Brassicogethes aeneus]|uniref:Craniofacial development protein 2-like n=1 Tax=Brassicogethes aeneus TaxID=1431903 RepID=A0A9P0FLF3_BRAAE|nr:unnamed protein product [Brassicogethes aeneus]
MEYKILATQEVKWKKEGKKDKNEYTVYYGVKKKQGRNGTAFMVSNREIKKLKGKKANMAIINVYSPTEDSSDEEKQIFYETIEKACVKIPKHDTLIILRDVNAKIGKEKFLMNVAGKYTINQESNDISFDFWFIVYYNGTRLCYLASEKNMLIECTRRT